MVDAFAKGDNLQVLLFSVLFGFALHAFGGRGTLMFDLVEKTSHVLFRIVGFIMKVAPIGAFGAMAFMSEARALTKLVGNGVATVVVAKWCGELDVKRMQEHLAHETPQEAAEPELVLDEKHPRMAT